MLFWGGGVVNSSLDSLHVFLLKKKLVKSIEPFPAIYCQYTSSTVAVGVIKNIISMVIFHYDRIMTELYQEWGRGRLAPQ